ncbi:hypothetical protein E2C01_025909 [Portunus trituberculatus]|uniref:Uncharacterized protein n=1 Tax=Portunus trituberculatus TaxID=210409 RepID=A0A5B7EEJ9_PORTR|nr:hypothetical protein [Portunus trituberculatus]
MVEPLILSPQSVIFHLKLGEAMAFSEIPIYTNDNYVIYKKENCERNEAEARWRMEKKPSSDKFWASPSGNSTVDTVGSFHDTITNLHVVHFVMAGSHMPICD